MLSGKENVLEVENDHFEHILGNCIDVVSQIRLVYGTDFMVAFTGGLLLVLARIFEYGSYLQSEFDATL